MTEDLSVIAVETIAIKGVHGLFECPSPSHLLFHSQPLPSGIGFALVPSPVLNCCAPPIWFSVNIASEYIAVFGQELVDGGGHHTAAGSVQLFAQLLAALGLRGNLAQRGPDKPVGAKGLAFMRIAHS
jgi:hypothetical protein